MNLIESQTVGSGGASSVVIGTGGTLPQTYKHLVIYITSKSTSTNAYDALYLRMNGDTTAANYGVRIFYGTTGGITQTNVGGTEGLFLTDSSGSSTSNYTFGVSKVIIPNYTSTSLYKGVLFWGSSADLSTIYQEPGGGMWSSTSAINSLTFRHASSNLAQNTKISVYGLS